MPYFCPSCNEQERRAKKAKRMVTKVPQGKGRGGPSSSSQPLEDTVKMRSNLKSHEALKRPSGSSASSRVPSQFLNTRKLSSSSRSRQSPENPPDLQDPGQSGESDSEEEVEEALVIDEVRRRGRQTQRQSREEEGRLGMEEGGGVVAQLLPSLGAQGFSSLPEELGWRGLEEEVEQEEEVADVVEDEDEEKDEEEEQDVSGLQEEEAWLQAVESGNLQQVKTCHISRSPPLQVNSCDSELRSVQNPSNLTARQRALGGGGGEGEVLAQVGEGETLGLCCLMLQLEFGGRVKEKVVSELTEEEKNVKALKRFVELFS